MGRNFITQRFQGLSHCACKVHLPFESLSALDAGLWEHHLSVWMYPLPTVPGTHLLPDPIHNVMEPNISPSTWHMNSVSLKCSWPLYWILPCVLSPLPSSQNNPGYLMVHILSFPISADWLNIPLQTQVVWASLTKSFKGEAITVISSTSLCILNLILCCPHSPQFSPRWIIRTSECWGQLRSHLPYHQRPMASIAKFSCNPPVDLANIWPKLLNPTFLSSNNECWDKLMPFHLQSPGLAQTRPISRPHSALSPCQWLSREPKKGLGG